VGEHAAEVGDGGRGERVAVGIDADDAVESSASMAIAVVLLVWGRP
jgi:hypothetical protein